jgi:hypothetical protein
MSTRGLATRGRVTRREYRLADGAPAAGWEPAVRWRRFSAWLLDIALFVVTLGIGWAVWTWRGWAHGSTPGKSLLGLTVFGSDTRRPATRDRMAQRALLYQGAAVLLGVATLGLGWLYCVAAALGTGRRTLYDEWSHTVLLQRPRQAASRLN